MLHLVKIECHCAGIQGTVDHRAFLYCWWY